jgi:hypothetical protein
MDVKAILEQLEKEKTTLQNVPLIKKQPRICIFYIKDINELHREFFPKEPKQWVLYVGESVNISERVKQHLECDQLPSTLRRSFGAILKQELKLKAIAGGNNKSESNIRNYRFGDKGERDLTCWMKQSLELSVYYCFEDKLNELKKGLIAQAKPLLNLTGWENPYRGRIEQLRKLCEEEAKT